MTDTSLAQLEEQLRFFKAAYGTQEGTPHDIMRASLTVLDLCSTGGTPHPDARLVLRHVIEQGRRYERERDRAKKLHETLLHVAEVVASHLDRLAEPAAPQPPPWLLSLATNLDLVLADAALENRR
jgi:hypothetical protein